MDFQHLVADGELLEEMLQRRSELVRPAVDGLEALEGMGDGGRLAEGLVRMNEGVYPPGEDSGLEAIVLRFTRPVFFVRGSDVTPPADSDTFAEGESAVITARMAAGQAALKAAVPSVGRVDLRNHRFDWVGTGWVVAPGVAVTNRHVAELFAASDAGSFPFRLTGDDRRVKASLDWRREYRSPEESVVAVRKVLWINPDDEADVALLQIADADEDGRPAPPPVPLMTQAEVNASLGSWVAVVGYPAQSAYNDASDQQRIFDGVYNVKRVAPGTVASVSPDGQFTHNATTLGGNSGSVVMDLVGGKAVGLHFGGFEGDRNLAVQAPVLAALVAAHS
ncbi:trypsin-like serine peptidase [Pseudonocardia charpentierae]|uniref:Serine protease n=1 Tax=Pseudonocardia charpentierae TaxID=3075545 RepID=A0ABU2NIW4_9PSEU|nr:serine protease [Pseudonocardia sp. DSM 45834]MDT0353917.1 serine protease [Pseudonocardia sp. DSM 45834]